MSDSFGADIGGVIIKEIKAPGGLAHIDENYLDVPPVPWAFESLARLTLRFGEQRFLISKAREEVEGNCRTWLQHYRFFEKTDIPASNLHFCRERSGKRAICEALGITHFVDDKLEVLVNLIGVVPNLYLFNPDEEETRPYSEHLTAVTIVQDWPALISLLGVRS